MFYSDSLKYRNESLSAVEKMELQSLCVFSKRYFILIQLTYQLQVQRSYFLNKCTCMCFDARACDCIKHDTLEDLAFCLVRD